MDIFIRMKAAGKRRDILEKQVRSVPDSIDRAEALIEYLVRTNVRAYNEAATCAPIFKYLSDEELDFGAGIGKVGFKDRKNEKDQDENAAVTNALQCYHDGIYKVLVNETEVLPGQDGGFVLKEGDVITFIRLVMLAGRRW